MTKKTRAILTVALVFFALLARFLCFDNQTADYTNFLQPWVREFREGGGFQTLAHTSSNYNLPYLYFLALISYVSIPDIYLIKALSVVFDLVLAFALYGIVRRSSEKAATAVLAAALFWLTFLLNSAYWAQCDSIYTAFCVLSFACILRERPKASVLFAGLAFAFKLQAVFYLPLFAVFLAARRVKLWHAALFPLPYAALSLPALMFGWPPSRIISVYTGQVGIYSDYLTLNAPSLFAFFPQDTPKQPYFTLGLVLAALFLALVILYAYRIRDRIDDRTLSLFALVMTLGVPWLLPSMHDRYFYMAEAFALLFAALRPRWRMLALMVQLGSLGGYHAYLVENRLSDGLWPYALVMLAALVMACYELVTTEKRTVTS